MSAMQLLVGSLLIVSCWSLFGKDVAYHPTTVSLLLARRWRASIWRLKSLPMATSSPRSA